MFRSFLIVFFCLLWGGVSYGDISSIHVFKSSISLDEPNIFLLGDYHAYNTDIGKKQQKDLLAILKKSPGGCVFVEDAGFILKEVFPKLKRKRFFCLLEVYNLLTSLDVELSVKNIESIDRFQSIYFPSFVFSSLKGCNFLPRTSPEEIRSQEKLDPSLLFVTSILNEIDELAEETKIMVSSFRAEDPVFFRYCEKRLSTFKEKKECLVRQVEVLQERLGIMVSEEDNEKFKDKLLVLSAIAFLGYAFEKSESELYLEASVDLVNKCLDFFDSYPDRMNNPLWQKRFFDLYDKVGFLVDAAGDSIDDSLRLNFVIAFNKVRGLFLELWALFELLPLIKEGKKIFVLAGATHTRELKNCLLEMSDLVTYDERSIPYSRNSFIEIDTYFNQFESFQV